ncbi:MAG TPA: hypothetical protein VFA85_19230 [Terriglobales bacterium]|nr:hypothetical protein [Terriglobales bacterium]
MKFAKIVFLVAGIWGVLVLTPLYFMFTMIGRQDPPPITHPAFYYGFVGTALAWQIAFFVIAKDPIRFRPMIIPSVIEKFTYAIALGVLFLQARLHATDLVFGVVDLLFGLSFIAAFFKTATRQSRPASSSA